MKKGSAYNKWNIFVIICDTDIPQRSTIIIIARIFHLALCGAGVTRSLVLYVCFVDRCLSFCFFNFGHCIVCLSSILLVPLISSDSSYLFKRAPLRIGGLTRVLRKGGQFPIHYWHPSC
jgi:hypothetical protein